MTLRLVKPGTCTLVVDHGRPSCRSLGVPVGGAADRWSLAIGNGLVGNPPETAALEICLAGPTLRANCELACVLYGAAFPLTSDRQRLAAGATFIMTRGEEIEIGAATRGMRAYFCVRGGVQAKTVLNSRSSLQPLSAGTELPCSPGTIAHRRVHEDWTWDREPRLLRTLDGA